MSFPSSFRRRENDSRAAANFGVVHHEIGEEHCGLTFTVNFRLAPRSFDRLSDACQYVDGLLTGATDYDALLRQTGEGSLTC